MFLTHALIHSSIYFPSPTCFLLRFPVTGLDWGWGGKLEVESTPANGML
jgi:hypothetical protein